MKGLITITALTLLVSGMAFGHEGHDHSPGTITAPNGGVIQETANLYFEVVIQKGGFRAYLFDHDLKGISLKDVKLAGSATFPRQKKSVPVLLTEKENHFVATVDSKGTHRYALELTADYKGKKEKAKFNIEPIR